MRQFKRQVMVLFMVCYMRLARAEIDLQTGNECIDQHENCPFWAETGECTKNRSWMGQNCRKSCDKCKVVRLNDHAEINAFMAKKKEEVMRKKKEAMEKREALRVLQGKEL